VWLSLQFAVSVAPVAQVLNKPSAASQAKTLPPAVKSVTGILRNQPDKERLLFKKINPEFYAG